MFIYLLTQVSNLPGGDRGAAIVAYLFGIVVTLGYTTFTFIGSFHGSVRADVS
ncbi:MAG: hypothetical protein U0793_26455 [Gemmataceae bacterium]